MKMILLKHKALPEGTTTIKFNAKSGKAYYYKKQQGKWVYAGSAGGSEDKRKSAKKQREHFAEVVKNPIISSILSDTDINSYAELKEFLAGNSRDATTKLFRNISDSLRKELGAKQGLAGMKSVGALFGTLIRSQKPRKTRLTVDVKSDNIKGYRTRKKVKSSVSFPAVSVKEAGKMMGTWKSVQSLPTSKDINGMISIGAGKLTRGKINRYGIWRMPTRIISKKNHVLVPFRPNEKGIKVVLQQQKPNVKRTSATAEAQITVPYAYAEKFLKTHIPTAKMQSLYIDQMKRSAGYKNSLAGEKIMEDKKGKIA